eukprot:TRINITY_DN1748_c0_g1_i1.p1 TRINITY_DN1748_c0_g1~~TRINITY_DN1748_c0_g1_i1.p1  ORF type:complete len:352 (+),score=97.58 TRINITY_DN1748_c0_g1_i1:126-1181(+)
MQAVHTKYFNSPQVRRKESFPARTTEKPLLAQLFEKKYEHSKVTVRQMVEATLAVEENKVKETGKNPTPPPYELDIKLGAGVFSEVFSAISKDGGPFALKRISKRNPKFNWKMVLREINAGKKVHHKGIVRFRDHFETSNNVYLVMDYFDGKDLYTMMEQTEFRPLDEQVARHLFRQLIKAVEYCHSKGVCHRDIKLENVLVNADGQLKMIDFGLCAVQSDGLCTDYVGTADYAAPEVLRREPYNGFKADVWSCAVFLYAILYGEFPFDLDEFLRCIKVGMLPELSWGVDNPAFTKASDSAKNFVMSMFVIDPAKRPTIKELKKHEWINADKKFDSALCAPLFQIAVSGRQ